VIETGIQHGTVLVLVNDTHLEVTTFRQPADRDTQINAHDISTDLAGRDFTINTLAFCLKERILIDPWDGVSDLANSMLRCVGEPQARFKEDPLRILRMIRFGDAQGREIEDSTAQAALQNVELLALVSVERIRSETEQIILSPYPAAGVRRMLAIGALKFTIPELLPAVGFEQNRYHIHDVFEHTMAVLDRAPADRILRWSAIFHDIGKPHTLSVGEDGERHFYQHEVVSTTLSWERMLRLKFSHDDMKRISSVVRHHMRPMSCGPAGVRRLIRDLGDNLSTWRAFKNADASPTIPSSEFNREAAAFDALLEGELNKMRQPSYGKLAVNGDDLKKELGLREGKQLGAILKQLEELIIEDPTRNSRDTLLNAARELLGGSK
jgi:tRNA nucleotidyltransferase (CCA-adding enzyme)